MVHLTSDTNRAEDLTQETFAAAWDKIDSFKSRASIKTWLHRIAYNKFIDMQRTQKRNTALLANLKKYPHDKPQIPSPLHRVINDESTHLLYQAVQKLKHAEYILIVLHYFQGFSFKEMTEILNEPVGTVKWRTSKALKNLQYLLTDRVKS